MLSRIAVTALLIVAPLGVAGAADMPVKARPAPPPPAFSWNGFYVGAQVGTEWGHSDWDPTCIQGGRSGYMRHGSQCALVPGRAR